MIESHRKIAVITGTRAEYGLLRGLLEEIKSDPDLQLQLIVTGMHLSPEFGLSYQLIEHDGFQIDSKVEMLLSTDTASGIAKSVALGVLGFTDALGWLKPDVIVILGDRFEMLAAAQAALFLKIPIAHIHGGELSAGALDDTIRHCITKLSHLHFSAAESYRKRIIQMGEQPERVFNVGALGVERIKKTKLLSKKELEKTLEISIKAPCFLFTYHPETIALETIDRDIQNILSALDAFPDAQIIMTKANADEAGRFINHQLQRYANQYLDRVKLFTNLGDLNYLSVLSLVDVVIGNSSSGIIEAPSLQVPTVNIGCRQEGRLRSASIIDCEYDAISIKNAVQKALSLDFKHIVKKTLSPYDCDETAKKIKDCLKKTDTKELVKKVFYDIEVHGYEQFENFYHCRSRCES